MTDTDMRTAWISTCMFWAWAWAFGAIFWSWTIIGLLLFIPAALSVWAIWIPVGRPQPAIPYTPPPTLPTGYGPPPVMPPH